MERRIKLHFLSEQFRGREVELDQDCYVIGRSPDSDIEIPDTSVSGLHCELVRLEAGGYAVIDQGFSTNGTRVGGLLVKEHPLIDGEVLQVGMIECLYEDSRHTRTTGTQNMIHIEEDALTSNPLHNSAPKWFHPKANPLVSRAIKGTIAALSVIVIILSVIMLLQIVGTA